MSLHMRFKTNQVLTCPVKQIRKGKNHPLQYEYNFDWFDQFYSGLRCLYGAFHFKLITMLHVNALTVGLLLSLVDGDMGRFSAAQMEFNYISERMQTTSSLPHSSSLCFLDVIFQELTWKTLCIIRMTRTTLSWLPKSRVCWRRASFCTWVIKDWWTDSGYHSHLFVFVS